MLAGIPDEIMLIKDQPNKTIIKKEKKNIIGSFVMARLPVT
jgi:hypothetical protein